MRRSINMTENRTVHTSECSVLGSCSGSVRGSRFGVRGSGFAVRGACSRRIFLHTGAVAIAGALLPSVARGQQGAAGITSTDLGGGAFLFQGAGGNVIAFAGADKERGQGGPIDQGALLIDGGTAANADALVATVTRATATSRISTLI